MVWCIFYGLYNLGLPFKIGPLGENRDPWEVFHAYVCNSSSLMQKLPNYYLLKVENSPYSLFVKYDFSYTTTRYKLGKNFFCRLSLHELWNGICHELNRRFFPHFFLLNREKSYIKNIAKVFSGTIKRDRKQKFQIRLYEKWFVLCVHSQHSNNYVFSTLKIWFESKIFFI